MEGKVVTRKQIAQKEISQRLKTFKKELRKKATPAEKVFKRTLKEYGLKFTFQKPFYKVDDLRCIADFYFWMDKPKIIVEIDGGYHNEPEQQLKDEFRTNWLKERRNCRVIRFTNNEVISSPNTCILKLADFYLNTVLESNSHNYTVFKSLKMNICQ